MAEAGHAGQPPPARISNSAVSASCCDGGSCSPTAFPSSSARAPSISCWSCWRPTARSSLKGASHRVWPGVVVSEENLNFQVSALRKALGADRDIIHTEFGRGYRFTGLLRSDPAGNPGRRPMRSRVRSGLIFYAELSAVALVQCQFGRKFQIFPARPRGRRTRQHASAFSKLIQPGRKDSPSAAAEIHGRRRSKKTISHRSICSFVQRRGNVMKQAHSPVIKAAALAAGLGIGLVSYPGFAAPASGGETVRCLYDALLNTMKTRARWAKAAGSRYWRRSFAAASTSPRWRDYRSVRHGPV